MAKKRQKLIMIIVEGISDKESLEMILEAIIPKEMRLKCVVANGDITTDPYVNRNNIRKKITEIITAPPNNHFERSDFAQVIHLVDMDGAYINEDKIFEDEISEKFIYSEDGIRTRGRERIIRRNKNKRELLEILTSTHKVNRSIPYKVLFMSCNLEHVLHNKINVPDEEKFELAMKFVSKFINQEDKFVSFICDNNFAVKDKEAVSLFEAYKSSWDFIKTGNNSIKRYTNFNLFFEKLRDGYNE